MKFIVNVVHNKQNKNLKKLLNFATLTYNHLKDKLKIDSDLLFYEQIYFFYFLYDIKFIGSNTSSNNRHKMLAELIQLLLDNHKLDNLENKELFKDTFIKRYKSYLSIFEQADFQYSADFFDNVIEYQTYLIASIDTQKIFLNYTPAELEVIDLEPGSEDSIFRSAEHYKNITDILLDNINLYLSFIDNQV